MAKHPRPVWPPGLIALFALALLAACSDDDEAAADVVIPEGARVTVTIDPALRAGEIDPRYIGFAFDTAQLTGGMWWEAGSEVRVAAETPDLESPKLRRLASYLAPSLLRIGGTDCDTAYFCPTPGPCELPESYRDVFREVDRIETTLTQENLRRAADFAEAVGAEVLFCINMGPGPRHPETGEWTPDDARVLIRFATSLPNGHVFTIWEPGNENNSAPLNFYLPRLDPELFAGDLVTFRALVDAEDPDGLVAAPDSFILPFGEPQDFTPALMAELERLGVQPIDVLSWHLYATQSTSCPAQVHPTTAENLFSETLADNHRGIARQMREAAGGLPVWNTESASAQCGGQQGVSDTLADALWYVDWIGIMAEEGTRLVVRHSLVGADYSLLEPDTFDPRPTFLALVMMRRTVTRSRLDTRVDRSRIKAHGFCGTDFPGQVTVVLANPNDEALVAEIELIDGVVATARQWAIGADGDLAATRATLNGEAAGADGTIPEPAGVEVSVVDGRAYAEVDASALAFVVVDPDTPATACVDMTP